MAEVEQFSNREVREWMAYERIDPFGEERADLRMGILAALIANVHRDRKQKKEPFTAEDFMPFIERPPDAYRRGMDLKRKFMRVTTKTD